MCLLSNIISNYYQSPVTTYLFIDSSKSAVICQEYSLPFLLVFAAIHVTWTLEQLSWIIKNAFTIKISPFHFVLNFHLISRYLMPSRCIQRSLSLPLLQIKCLQRRLSFVRLAPIPEVLLRMPSHPNLKEVKQLLDLIDFCVEDSKSEVPCPDSSAQT